MSLVATFFEGTDDPDEKEEVKKERRTDWSVFDDLPIKDPIGDVD